MLVQKGKPSGRRAVHMIFSTADLRSGRTIQGIPVPPLADLVTMKLTRFRIEDGMCLNDLDEQRLITAEIEASLPPLLKERLSEVRARG